MKLRYELLLHERASDGLGAADHEYACHCCSSVLRRGRRKVGTQA